MSRRIYATHRTLAHGCIRLNTDPMRPMSHGPIIPLANREASPTPARTRLSLRAILGSE